MAGHRKNLRAEEAAGDRTVGCRRILLTGFMGAGKSTVGAVLALRLGWRFIDVDVLVEAKAGVSIADLFAREGEASFRRLEAGVVADLCHEEHAVIALGGGAVETEAVCHSLAAAEGSLVVYLDAPLEVLVGRCELQPGAAARPVLADRARLKERFERRLPHYRALAHLSIPTADRTTAEVCAAIAAHVSSQAAIPPCISGMHEETAGRSAAGETKTQA